MQDKGNISKLVQECSGMDLESIYDALKGQEEWLECRGC